MRRTCILALALTLSCSCVFAQIDSALMAKTLKEAQQQLRETNDLDEKERMYNSLVKFYPAEANGQSTLIMANAYAEAGNVAKAKAYFQPYTGKDRLQMQASVGFVLGEKDPATGIEFLAPAVDSLAKNGDKRTYSYCAASLADLLIQDGQADKGYNLATALYKDAPESTIAIYIHALVATNRLSEAFPLMEEQFKTGNADDVVKAKFKDAYVKVKGTDKGVDEYRLALENENIQKMKTAIAKQVINEPSVDFKLLDVNGKTVRLSDMKGKIVILDFWATWCGPCKASFPGMQTVVNKYKDNADVVFLFIHTLDKGTQDPTIDARDYVEKNNYTFRVLMDLRNKNTQKSKVATDYQLTGIPTKFVIDKKGQIRFKLIGFGGGQDAAVNELSAMIDYLK